MDPNEIVAVDIETTGLQWADRMLTVSLARKSESGIETKVINVGYYQQPNLFGLMGAPLDSRDIAITPVPLPEARFEINEFVGRRRVLVMHNTSFDLPYLYRAGIFLPGPIWDDYRIFDTMVLARATGQHESVSLASLCEEIGIRDSTWDKGKGVRAHLEDEPWDEVEEYSALDARYTWELAYSMWPKAEEFYGPFGSGGLLDEESQWVKLVSELRFYGLQVDQRKIERLRQTLADEMKGLTAKLKAAGIQGPNHKSSLMEWCEKEGILAHLGTTAKGNPSTNKDSMKLIAAYQNPSDAEKQGRVRTTAKAITRARSVEKALSTWIAGTLDEMDESGRVHPLFTTSGTVSNRLTCKKPNVQAYPQEYKPFGAREGYDLWSLDWSQAELRIAAIYAQEKPLAEILAVPGADPHQETAYLIFGAHAGLPHRKLAKRANFGSIYGAGYRAIMEATGCGEDEARELLRSHRGIFKRLAHTSKKAEHTWTTRGYLILMSGKRLYASKDDLERRPYKAFNQLIQGNVAEMIKTAMLQIRELAVQLVSQIHDSIEFEAETGDQQTVDQAIEIMRDKSFNAQIQQTCVPFVPLYVDAVRYGPL